jgi:hypothetical protein
MSDAVEIVKDAPLYIEDLIADMIREGVTENRVLLGSVLSGNDEIQIQLFVTRNQETMMDES